MYNERYHGGKHGIMTVRNVIVLSGNKRHDSLSVLSSWLVVVLVVTAELHYAAEELD